MSHVIRTNPPTLPDPAPFAFSHSTTTKNSGRYVFISGQNGGEGGQQSFSRNFRTQVQYALKNLVTVLAIHQLNVGDVMKLTVLIANLHDQKVKIWRDEMQNAWGSYGFPAVTMMSVPGLSHVDMQVEVDAIAFIADK